MHKWQRMKQVEFGWAFRGDIFLNQLILHASIRVQVPSGYLSLRVTNSHKVS